MAKRQKVIAGNWKMHKNLDEAMQFFKEIMPIVNECSDKVYIAAPFTHLKTLCDNFKSSNLVIGAQNMNDASKGAFTGEISAFMLKDVGAKFVLLGHSERRHIFGESNEFINKKVKRALTDNLQPVLCIGETLEERESGHMKDVLQSQLEDCLNSVTADQLNKMLIAYEPVWAIGTGVTATAEQAEEAHRFTRKLIENKWGKDISDLIPILYGGSVTPDNVKILMEQVDIDGVLVGGASLKSDSFAKIINYQTIKV